ncbi:peroxide-responsive transcriptional repressor PerR [Campylobacter sp.]|uniref:peroxide-responsive transcriptional repressor PerR n=1 Tax=Campylobacter sp. TaxID=205 RepID=UPI0026DD32E7|nr:peroxide-responsive transcriptional repressor PerR [Campylobacter sp.]MDO4673648.1 peroxide-responsive transcriptional repressor PerR [Campylobacter sp.]
MDLMKMLNEQGLKATPQRLCMLKILKRHEHPTIDELYAEIKKDYPSIALATVYKNLNTLQKQGLVVVINVANEKSCYDIYDREHMHIICSKCGSIEDKGFEEIGMDEYQKKLEKRLGYFIEHFFVCSYVKSCPKCR